MNQVWSNDPQERILCSFWAKVQLPQFDDEKVMPSSQKKHIILTLAVGGGQVEHWVHIGRVPAMAKPPRALPVPYGFRALCPHHPWSFTPNKITSSLRYMVGVHDRD